MKKSLYMTMVAIAISLVAAGCGEQKSSGYTKEEIIQKHSQYIPRSQIEAYLNGENSSEASAAVLNLVRYGISDEFDRDVANMKK